LTEDAMATLIKRFWKLAVITIEEDGRLNRIARSRAADSPDERWRRAGISFEDDPDAPIASNASGSLPAGLSPS
jgi:hypothetical protein